MARIVLEVVTAQGVTLTVEKSYDDTRFADVLALAYQPPEGLTARQRLEWCLAGIERVTLALARQRRMEEIQATAPAQADAEVVL
jgi:hypothetical protein